MAQAFTCTQRPKNMPFPWLGSFKPNRIKERDTTTTEGNVIRVPHWSSREGGEDNNNNNQMRNSLTIFLKMQKKNLLLGLYLNYWKHTSLNFKFEKPIIPKTKIFEALEIKEKLVMACKLFVCRNKEFMVNKQAAQNPPLFNKEKSFLMTILAGLGNWKKKSNRQQIILPLPGNMC